MKYLLLAVTLSSCVASAPKKAPERALKVVWNKYRGHSVKSLALDAKHVYLLDSDDERVGVRRIPRGGGAPEDIVENSTDGRNATTIAVDDTHVYWIMLGGSKDDGPQTQVMRAPKKLEARAETLASVGGMPGDLVLVGAEIIFSTVEENPAIYRVNKAGGSNSTVVDLPPDSEPVDLLPHDGKLLVAEYEHDVIQEVTVQGEIREVMKVENPREIAVHNGQIHVVALSGVYDATGKKRTRSSDSALFDSIADAPEGLYYGHGSQLRFLPWNSDQSVILQKASFGVDDIVIADEGLYYVNDHVVYFRARKKSS